ncbi:MAG: ATP-binding cassette domain-containing protein [Streptosporangiales bacterium]|nr:ATP-binding cassette domain-containing protein [Streptosporangiales bacterium]
MSAQDVAEESGRPGPAPGETPLLEARSMTVHLRDGSRTVRAVDDVGLTIQAGECVGIVGESGSGKSMLGRALVRLLPPVELERYSGEVIFDGTDLAALPEAELRELRRRRSISMVFQDPLRYLNPAKRVGAQVAEAIWEDSGTAGEAAADELFDLVGLPGGTRIGRRYPHQLSGGMRQRVLLALALASRRHAFDRCADEPPLRELGDGRTVRCWLDGADLGLQPAGGGGATP